jgi:hypothetical protein|tara:strand:+ start:1254 stop:1544 length:291 start_codon:yes stop_codon:yes gene_type:complete
MWDPKTLSKLNNERVEYLRAQKLRQEESVFKKLDSERNTMPKRERDYVYKYVPVHMQDKGAYDEGYYYNYCYDCGEKTEHEDESCCVCNAHNPDSF